MITFSGYKIGDTIVFYSEWDEPEGDYLTDGWKPKVFLILGFGADDYGGMNVVLLTPESEIISVPFEPEHIRKYE